jgi:hypothetical protein
MTKTFILPIIHSNGTSKEELVELRCECGRVLSHAMEALGAMAPNGRDYYPKPGLIEKALDQHWKRMKMLKDLHRDISDEAIAIYDLT